MENIQRAIIMAGEVFLFVLALTVGIFLYSTLINTQETILVVSERNNRRAETTNTNLTGSYRRIAKGSEAVWAVLSMLDDVNYVADCVDVTTAGGHKAFYKSSRNEIKGFDLKTFIGNSNYEVDYQFDYPVGSDVPTVTVFYRYVDD